MSRALGIALVVMLVGSTVRAFAAADAPSASDELQLYRARQIVFEQAAARVAPCVVTIETVGGTQPPSPRVAASGPAGRPRREVADSAFIIADGPTTGLIYDSDGLIITSAFNFVRNPSVITVTLADGRRFVGELLAKDEIRRLAMVKIDANGLPTPNWVEQEDRVLVGQSALALGRGFRTDQPAITAGIISGKNRQAGLAIQTDAKLSPGNFGGPLIEIEGRVLGLAVPMGLGTGAMAGVEWYDSGIGFAIPFWQIKQSATDLALGHSLRRGMIGIRITPGLTRVVRVAAVADPSPALRAGIQAGDIIIAIDGETVTDYPSLQKIMITRQAGQRVNVKIKRNDQTLDLSVVLAVPEDIGEIPSPLTPEPPGEEPEREPGPDEPEGEEEPPTGEPDRTE
jgi:serine protease Do